MPLKKVCSGCRRLYAPTRNSRGRCPDCQRADWRQRNHQRDPLAKAVYQSREYRAARAIVLAGATRCAWCGATGVELTAGHVVPISERPDLAASLDNLRPQCRSCQEKEKWRR